MLPFLPCTGNTQQQPTAAGAAAAVIQSFNSIDHDKSRKVLHCYGQEGVTMDWLMTNDGHIETAEGHTGGSGGARG